jgi:hypothetical protein
MKLSRLDKIQSSVNRKNFSSRWKRMSGYPFWA